MDDEGVRTTVLDARLSPETSCSSVSLQLSRVCIVTEYRGTCLELNCRSVSITADLATHCWPLMGNIASKSWLMIDEWSYDLILAVERMLAEVSTVQMFSLVFLGEFSNCRILV